MYNIHNRQKSVFYRMYHEHIQSYKKAADKSVTKEKLNTKSK